jgi:hypothetical protein
MKQPDKLTPAPPEIEAHHRVTISLMGKRYAIDFTATAQELTSNVVEIRPPAARPQLVLLPPVQKT